MAPDAKWPGVIVYFKWIVNKCRSPWTKFYTLKYNRSKGREET